MALPDKRQEIADVLSDFDGITGHVYVPTAPQEGDAWPQFDSIAIETGETLPTYTWLIYVKLPAIEQDAMRWQDERLEDLIAWLKRTGVVKGGRTINLGTTTSPEPGLEITLESD